MKNVFEVLERRVKRCSEIFYVSVSSEYATTEMEMLKECGCTLEILNFNVESNDLSVGIMLNGVEILLVDSTKDIKVTCKARVSKEGTLSGTAYTAYEITYKQLKIEIGLIK